jgi:4a-hydroxytetrahydrobiopterin dehydratase
MTVLDKREVERRLQGLPGWQRHEDEIRKEYRFGDFRTAVAFVDLVAQAAEAADHHPDIEIKYNRVRMTLSTHSEGGVTEKDIARAARIDAAAAEVKS